MLSLFKKRSSEHKTFQVDITYLIRPKLKIVGRQLTIRIEPLTFT